MAVTEQLNIRLEPGEKARVAAAARRRDSTVSDYVRERLFGRMVDDADQALIDMLVDLKPKVTEAIRTIDGNLAEIRKLRSAKLERKDADVAARARKELSEDELTAVADRLRLAPAAAPRGARRVARR